LRASIQVSFLRSVRDYTTFNTQIISARWNEEEGMWYIKSMNTQTKEEKEEKCNVFINGSGLLSKPRYPNIPGMKDFKGKMVHVRCFAPRGLY
jgi:cation diffusion facilitator CzcD-associated flavoprotein CzcO